LGIRSGSICKEAQHEDFTSFRIVGAMHECRARLIDDTVKSVGSPLLSSVHRSTADGVEEVVRR
jgi:hypothetical protein